jgi:rhodanese-related sulfurtransferase
MIVRSVKDLVAEAGRSVRALSGQEAALLVGTPGAVLVDVREADELQKTGRIKGAIHVPRGLLEFQADPGSPTYRPELGCGKTLVVYCGSGSRSALAAKTLGDMGIEGVAHVVGGFPALHGAGAPTEP